MLKNMDYNFISIETSTYILWGEGASFSSDMKMLPGLMSRWTSCLLWMYWSPLATCPRILLSSPSLNLSLRLLLSSILLCKLPPSQYSFWMKIWGNQFVKLKSLLLMNISSSDSPIHSQPSCCNIWPRVCASLERRGRTPHSWPSFRHCCSSWWPSWTLWWRKPFRRDDVEPSWPSQTVHWRSRPARQILLDTF